MLQQLFWFFTMFIDNKKVYNIQTYKISNLWKRSFTYKVCLYLVSKCKIHKKKMVLSQNVSLLREMWIKKGQNAQCAKIGVGAINILKLLYSLNEIELGSLILLRTQECKHQIHHCLYNVLDDTVKLKNWSTRWFLNYLLLDIFST